eukprot:5568342-Alexandrium_andersonii.AAC.1
MRHGTERRACWCHDGDQHEHACEVPRTLLWLSRRVRSTPKTKSKLGPVCMRRRTAAWLVRPSPPQTSATVSYTHLRAHETSAHL